MIRAVFFDWFNTLARYEPPREELQSQALQEFGIHISPQKVFHSLLVADQALYEENASFPIRKRSPEEQAELYIRHQHMVLTGVGVDITGEPDLPERTLKRMQELSQGIKFALYDDVLPTLEILKARSLSLGLLTNLDSDMKPICRGLGLEPYIDFTVTAGEVGVDKPDPPIFLEALKKAGVKASEAVHVGDQYKSDVAGARGVGITPVLIDRYELYPEINDCPRIRSLTELIKYL